MQDAGFESRVWVEEWTTRHARRGAGRAYPDRARRRAYGALDRPMCRMGSRWLMRSPARNLVGNDIFALARPIDGRAEPGLPSRGRYRALG